MIIGSNLELGLAVALFSFLLMISVGLITLRWRKHRGEPRPVRMAHLWRYLGSRAAVAAGLGVATFAVAAAFGILNTDRPPDQRTPTIRVLGASGAVTVNLTVKDCDDTGRGRILVTPPGTPGPGVTPTARLRSGQGGVTNIAIGPGGRGRFELEDPSSERGLLSCFVRMPMVTGTDGPVRTRLALGEAMQVDTIESVPAPAGYRDGYWYWECPPGGGCSFLATIGLSFELGAKQVIVLVLASLIGAVVALTIGETVLEPLRRRLRHDEKRAGGRPPPPGA